MSLWLLLSFLLSAFLSWLFTPLTLPLAKKVGAVAVPDERRHHRGVIPQLGGMAIFLAFILVSLLLLKIGLLRWEKGLKAIMLGGILISILGMVDDIKDLPPFIKFIGQAVISGLTIWMGLRVTVISSPLSGGYIEIGLWGIIGTFIWLVGMTNAMNFIDGLDGLAAGVTVISAGALLWLSIFLQRMEVALLFSALAGAALGFLPYNFHPAKTFMGDTGAMFLGYTISALAVMGAVKTALLVAIGVPLFVLALPILDTLFVTSKRIANKRSPFSGDRGHIHHTLLKMGYSEREAVLLLYGVTLFFSFLALLLARA